jgi:hypothetical protein
MNMRQFIFMTLVFLSGISLSGQERQNALIIEGQTKLSEVLEFESQYIENEFLGGSLVYRDFSRSTGEFNYNIIRDEVHFINENNDTLALAKPEDISFVSFGNRVFTYTRRQGYMEQMVLGNVRLMLKRKVDITSENNYVGAFGTIARTTTVRPVDNFDLLRGTRYHFDPNVVQTARIKYSESVFLESKGKVYPFNRVAEAERAVGKKYREKFNVFLKSEGINFGNFGDLIKAAHWIGDNL